MLEIMLTPTMVHFKNLSDEMLFKLCKDYDTFEFKSDEKGVYVRDTPQKLYKLLLDLSYKYDIELT